MLAVAADGCAGRGLYPSLSRAPHNGPQPIQFDDLERKSASQMYDQNRERVDTHQLSETISRSVHACTEREMSTPPRSAAQNCAPAAVATHVDRRQGVVPASGRMI